MPCCGGLQGRFEVIRDLYLQDISLETNRPRRRLRRDELRRVDHFLFGLVSLAFSSRTPGPPPFSSMNSPPAHWHLFGASSALREPQTHTAAVLRYELDTSSFKRLNDGF